jgi:hypothetical protein
VPLEVTSHRFVQLSEVPKGGKGFGTGLEVRDDGGQTIRTFGFGDVADPDITHGRSPVLCSGKEGGTFWSFFYGYRGELWDTAGKKLRSFSRAGDWGGPLPIGSRGWGTPWSCSVDRDGLLWMMITISRPGRYESMGIAQRRMVSASAQDSLYYTMIEVIDPARGLVVASQLFEQHLGGAILGGNRVLHLRESDAGELTVEVLRLRMQ